MNNEHEQRLAAAIDRELKQLPELSAPDTLIARVRAKIEAPAPVRSPGYSWSAASLPQRQMGFALLVVLFGGLCFGVWQLMESPLTVSALSRFGQSFSGLLVLWNTISVLVGAAGMALKTVNPVIIALGLVLISLAYAACIGVGTVLFRFAYLRR